MVIISEASKNYRLVTKRNRRINTSKKKITCTLAKMEHFRQNLQQKKRQIDALMSQEKINKYEYNLTVIIESNFVV